MGDACAVVDNAKGVIHQCVGISQNESSTKTDKETPIGHQAKDESCPKVVDTFRSMDGFVVEKHARVTHGQN